MVDIPIPMPFAELLLREINEVNELSRTVQSRSQSTGRIVAALVTTGGHKVSDFAPDFEVISEGDVPCLRMRPAPKPEAPPAPAE
jgi:hypothetical protein